jgi:hypothetical protein
MGSLFAWNTHKAPLLTKEGWQPLRLMGWFSLTLLTRPTQARPTGSAGGRPARSASARKSTLLTKEEWQPLRLTRGSRVQDPVSDLELPIYKIASVLCTLARKGACVPGVRWPISDPTLNSFEKG